MLDFSRIGQYRENNRIEAKKALGGLPRSIWETYSAFANTLGGVILLGVEEYRDHSLHTIDLPDPERLVREFWSIVNDPEKVSVNILTDGHVQIVPVGGQRIIAITVPRAQRYDRPVYIGGDPMLGTYRRSGEGDYRCTPEEVEGMRRDAAVQTQDMQVLDGVEPGALDRDSVARYRARMGAHRPGHPWEELEPQGFLTRLGALGTGRDGALHPTAAGLLMFGTRGELVQQFPGYRLDYREYMGPSGGESGRVTSDSGAWSGNLHDFYFLVWDRLTRGLEVPRGGDVGAALGEALANCLTNADYYGRQGVSVVRRADRVTFSNPGSFRIEVEAARSGGVSDPRNGALARMFSLVSVGKQTGSGIPSICSLWRELGWAQPALREHFAPERITLTLPLGSGPWGGERRGRPAMGRVKKQQLIDYLTDHVSATPGELADYVQLSPSRTRKYLKQLAAEDIITVEGGPGGQVYKLKA